METSTWGLPQIGGLCEGRAHVAIPYDGYRKYCKPGTRKPYRLPQVTMSAWLSHFVSSWTLFCTGTHISVENSSLEFFCQPTQEASCGWLVHLLHISGVNLKRSLTSLVWSLMRRTTYPPLYRGFTTIYLPNSRTA